MSEWRPFDAEAITAALAYAATAQGDATSVTALAVSTPRFEETGFDDDYGDRLSYYNDLCTTVLTLYLEVPAESFGQFYQVREGVQERIFDMLWPIIASQANADLTALTQEMPVSCRDNQFTEFIDHIVVDPRVLPWVDRSSFRQITYRQADKAVWSQLSDHCPVEVELWVR